MAFFGVFGAGGAQRACFDMRAHYLCAPALHFSIDGRVALCHDMGVSPTDLLALHPALFVATAAEDRVSLGIATVAVLYRRYGKRLRRHLALPSAFAVYDARRGSLLLGGTGGKKCYLEEVDGTLFFSSEPCLLRAPVPIDLALIK